MATPERPRSLEEAEIRKLEAETTEIKVRTAVRLAALFVLLAVLGTDLGGIADLLGRWVPMI